MVINTESIFLQLQIQSVEIDIEGDGFTGMPFVLVSAGNWIKDKGSDFYVDLSARSKKVCHLIEMLARASSLGAYAY